MECIGLKPLSKGNSSKLIGITECQIIRIITLKSKLVDIYKSASMKIKSLIVCFVTALFYWSSKHISRAINRISEIIETEPGRLLLISDQGRTRAKEMAVWSRFININLALTEVVEKKIK